MTKRKRKLRKKALFCIILLIICIILYIIIFHSSAVVSIIKKIETTSKFDYTLYNSLLSLEPTFMAKFPTLPMCEFGVNQFPKSGDTDTRKSLTNLVPNFYEFWDTTINKKCICFNKTWLDTNGNLIP